jgi:hypothetical protein
MHMKTERLLTVLTVLNASILATTLIAMRPTAETIAPVLRGRALEIVDDQGRTRASLNVMPPGTSKHGDRFPETVLLRLITERGRPSVKISTSEQSAGVSLAGPSGTTNTYVILAAEGTASSLKLRNENGRQQVVQP